MRSSVVPHTMASETAQKTNWKNHFASIVASDRPMTGKACCGSPNARRKKPSVPMMWPRPPPKAKAKPTAQYMIPAIEKFVTILAMTVPAFFARENPISRNAKPACMNMTRQPATITQSELIPTESGIPFFEPTASIRSATGRDMQPPWLARPQSSVSQPGSALDNGRKWRQGISPRGRKPPRMPRFEVSRTLVKSPPELWAELGPDCLEKALGAVSVQETEPER